MVRADARLVILRGLPEECCISYNDNFRLRISEIFENQFKVSPVCIHSRLVSWLQLLVLKKSCHTLRQKELEKQLAVLLFFIAHVDGGVAWSFCGPFWEMRKNNIKMLFVSAGYHLRDAPQLQPWGSLRMQTPRLLYQRILHSENSSEMSSL